MTEPRCGERKCECGGSFQQGFHFKDCKLFNADGHKKDVCGGCGKEMCEETPCSHCTCEHHIKCHGHTESEGKVYLVYTDQSCEGGYRVSGIFRTKEGAEERKQELIRGLKLKPDGICCSNIGCVGIDEYDLE